MRGLVLERPGGPVAVEELQLAPPGAGEVAVRLLASGVCHSDLHLVDAEWTNEHPVVLGHEGCGRVEQVGDGVDPAVVGQMVVLDWFSPCFCCARCVAGQPCACRGTRALEDRLPDGGTRLSRPDGEPVFPYLGIGTLAERTVVATRAAVPIGSDLPPPVGALIGCCVSTGVGAVVKTAAVPAGASVVVYGLGGVGLSVVMGAALAGAASITVVDRTTAKLDLARSVGATAGVLADRAPDATVEAVLEATGGGSDFAFEAIGLSETIEQTIRSVRAGGTAVLVGMTPFGVRPSFDAYDVVDRSLRIVGSNYGFTVGPADFPRYAALYRAGRLPIDRLVERRIDLAEAVDALDALRRGDGARRVVVFPG